MQHASPPPCPRGPQKSPPHATAAPRSHVLSHPRLPPLRVCGTQASFIETNLRDVRVEDVNLSRSYWQGVQTRGMAFVDSWLTDAFLVGVNFDGVNMNGPCRLQGADLGYARFTNAMLQELQLEGAKATGASFDNSKMNIADFTRALLDGASFRQTILTDATFHAADINECDFTSAVGVDKASFLNVIGTPIGLVG